MTIVPVAWAGTGPEFLVLINHGSWRAMSL
jgi:hypothetical protein